MSEYGHYEALFYDTLYKYYLVVLVFSEILKRFTLAHC